MGTSLRWSNVVKAAWRAFLRKSLNLQAHYIRSREYFPHLLNAKNLLGEGVEVGVQDGYYSDIILSNWRGRRLYSIDSWKEFPTSEYIDLANVPQEEQEKRYQNTINRLRQFAGRSCVLRATSKEAAQNFKEGQLDFVYLDAQHHYDAIKEDILLWHPKVRKGGILAGHDYVDGEFENGIFGVKSAVDEFAALQGGRLVISRESDWKSWFLFI